MPHRAGHNSKLSSKGEIMFTLDSTIEAVQNSKKQVVSTFVQNEVLAKAFNDFIDAQTDYTRKALKTSTDTMTTVGQEFAKTVAETAKTDYTKMSETFTKVYTDLTKSVMSPTTKAASKKAA
jgi:hypothetical protein